MGGMFMNIGKKISKYRKLKDLTIRELASLANVTPSLLSQIERGLANPSINTLKLVSKALNVPIYQFFLETPDNKDLIVRANERKKMIFPNSSIFSYELLTSDLSGNIEFILMKLSPGSASSDKPMGHNGEEVAFIINNKVKLYLDDNEYVLDEGDSVKIPPMMKHKWENSFDKTVSVIFAITPPVF